MTSLTEIVAAVVVHSSTVALSHFGVTVTPAQVEKPAPAERVIARTPRPAEKVADCPAPKLRPHALKA